MIVTEISQEELDGITPEWWSWEEDPLHCCGIYEGSSVIAGGRAFFRQLVIGSFRMNVYGIGGLVTVPSRRRCGLGGLIIEYIADRARDEGGYYGLVANSTLGPKCVFRRHGFRAIGPSKTRAGQDLYYRSLLEAESETFPPIWTIFPDTHF